MNNSADGGMRRVLRAIQELSLASDLAEVQRIARVAVRDLAGCDGATFVLRDGDLCYYADEDAIEPLWKGMRFPLEACISGWAMLHREHVSVPDIYVDDRIPHDAYRPTFVKSLLMVPIRTLAPVGAIGAYWASPHEPSELEIDLLRSLADATSLALEKVSVHQELEREVRLADEALRLSETDELTGVLNRRGFARDVERTFQTGDQQSGAVAFVDVNGLKRVNDIEGHAAGDELIAGVARAMVAAVRPGDVIGRIGGDEFAAFAPGLDPSILRDRLTLALGGRASVGVAGLAAATALQASLLVADAEMYAEKRRLGRRDIAV